MALDISIIIPHLNQSQHLETLLAALFAQTIERERAEIIVVDNGSRELPRAIIERFPGVILAEAAVPGPGPARNRGVALSRSPLLAFTDADCRPEPDWLEHILARFQTDPELAIIGGDVRVYPVHPEAPTIAEAYDALYAFRQRDYIMRQGFSVTANLATRRAIYDKVGPFAGIEIAEDTDWGHRAARLGYRTVYAPEVIVNHPARQFLADLYAKWDRNVNHHYAAFAATSTGKAKWLAKTLALGISPLFELPRILSSDRISGANMRWRAFEGLTAVRFYRARKMLEVMLRPEARTPGAQWNR